MHIAPNSQGIFQMGRDIANDRGPFGKVWARPNSFEDKQLEFCREHLANFATPPHLRRVPYNKSMEPPLLQLTGKGLYCLPGDFYVDPWQPVERAVITHAHADHAHRGCHSYLASQEGEHIFRVRLGEEAALETVPYAQVVQRNGTRVSLHPAGHILGSAQVRIEHHG